MDEGARDGLELELPRGDHRERLLAALGNLISRRGFETFVAAPILLPRSEYFPERWEPTVVGARRLLRRLMHYAGLADLKVRLEGWRERPVISGELSPRHTDGHWAAWFGGIRDGTCEFGVEIDQLRHEESLVAALGHEVAHAFRDHHGLVTSDRDLEEKLTDLTCVYLGFGVFSLNASHVVETGGVSPAGQKLLYETRSLGYLSPGELALLLAAQLAVRSDVAEQRAVGSVLLPNHAALVEQGLRDFAEEDVRPRLHVPEPGSWAPRVGREEISALPDDDEPPEQAVHPEEEPAALGDVIVFRVRQDRAAGLCILSLVGAAIAGTAIGIGTLAFYGLCAVAAAAGLVAGRRLRADECSSCRARLARDDEHCAGCGGRVTGEIATRDQRLEAEERHRAERGDAEPDEDDEDEDEDPVAVLFTAMLAAWGLSRELLTEDAEAPEKELLARVRALDFDTDALYAAWIHGALLTDEAMRFADYYSSEPTGLRHQDFDILTTANQLDARPANYQRFAAILDRRFADWRARERTGSG